MPDKQSSEELQVLPWQAAAWHKLRKQIDSGQFAHALIVAGPAGIGKARFALALANYLLCERPGEFACGACRACTFLKAGTHADYRSLQPEEPGKAIRVDQVRELSRFVEQTAQHSGRKIILLEPADALNMNAANALLKSLEEPGDDTHFLLVCTAAKRLPATVRSRCQSLVLAAPPQEIALSWLAGQLQDPAEALRRLQCMPGRPCAALRAAETDMQIHESVRRGVQMITQTASVLPDVAKQWCAWPLQPLLEFLLTYIVQITRATNAADGYSTAHAEAHQTCTRIARLLGDERLFAIYDVTLDTLRKLQHGASPNKQLAVERVLLEFHRPDRHNFGRASAAGESEIV